VQSASAGLLHLLECPPTAAHGAVVPERNDVDLARRAVSKRSLSTADLKPISQYPRSIDRCTPIGQIVPHEDQRTRGRYERIEIDGGF
jgi:hypothetical protein